MFEKEAAGFVFSLLNGNSWWQISITAIGVISVTVGLVTWAIRSYIKTKNMYIESAVNNYKKGHLDAQDAPKDYSIQVFKNPNVRFILRSIRHDLQADRVTVYQYHNGEKSIANNPFLKVSCTHEVLSENTLSVIDHMKDKQIDIFDGTTTEMFEGRIYKQKFVTDLHKNGDSRTLAQTLSQLGTTSIYMFPLKTPLGKIFGFGAVEYCCSPTDLDDKWLHWVSEKYSQIGALLAVEDLVKANEIEQLQQQRKEELKDV